MTEFDFAAARESVDSGFAAAIEQAGEKLRQRARQRVYFDNPHIWAKEVLRDPKSGDPDDGIFLWSKQREIGKSLVDNSYTSVKSCHGSGKSMSAAVFVCWFVATRLAENDNPESVFVITTAPTYAQVHLVLWEEIRRFHALGNLPGYITSQDEWKIMHNGRIRDLAVGRKPADTDSNGFQGKHADNLLIVLDEANGIPRTLFTGAVSMLTGDMTRQKLLAIGNPDDPNSFFGQEDAKDRKRAGTAEDPKFWNQIQIKAWDTPNFTGEDVPDVVKKAVLSENWVKLAEMQWTKTDARWISKVEAEFPNESSDSFFSRSLIEQSQISIPDPEWAQEVNYLGVDIARYGKDRTVLAHNLNGVITIVDSWSKTDTIATTRKINEWARKLHVTQVRVDEGNVGGAVIDMLLTMKGYEYEVVKMNSSNSSPSLIRWRNARAFWYDNLRESMMLNRIQLPKSDELEAELMAIRYKLHAHGSSLLLESKDEIAKRLEGKSTDYADAVVYAAADLSIYIELDEEGNPPPQPGEERIIDIGFETMLAQQLGGFTVSPV